MSSISNQTLNPFTTPKETKKQPVEPIGGKMGDFDETENYFETTKFISQGNFIIEPAAAVAEAEAIIREAAVSKNNVIYGELLGSLNIRGDTETFIEQTRELKIDTTEPRDINITAQDQKDLFAGLFSAGTDTIKDMANKAVSTLTDVGTTTAEVIKDTVIKDTLGFGVKKETPKTPEEIEKANEAAAQKALEQKFQAHLTIPHPEVNIFELDNKVVSRSQLEEALGIRITGENVDEKGKLKANKETEGKKALDDMAKQQEAAAAKAEALAKATKSKGGIMGQGELDKGTENPNHFSKAAG